MTLYKPGPYEVEIFYVEAGLTHKQRLNCNIVAEGAVGDPFSAFSVALRNGTNIALNTAVDAYTTLMKARLGPTTNITIANLYKYVVGTYDKNFLATYDINLIGTGAGAALNHQTVLTFTTQLGNNVRWEILEDGSTLSTRIPIRDAVLALQNIANYLVGPTGWVIARDGSYPTGKLNSSEGQNEAIFKKRNR